MSRSAAETYARQQQAGSATVSWKGYDWNVTNGGMAGVAPGDPNNVSVDANGYLHLRIAQNGNNWTAAELYSTKNLGFGTYQWQVAGPVDRMDPVVVLGLSPYGPAAGVGKDGYNEIDTEFSQWNGELGHVNMDWGVYPATSAGTHQEKDFFFSLNGGSAATTRMTWNTTSVASAVLSGFVSLGDDTGLITSYTYAPADPNDNIPQQPLPVLINLWCYNGTPTTGGLEVVIQDFQFIPQGQPLPGADASVEDAAPAEGGVADAGSGATDAALADAGDAASMPVGAPDAGGAPEHDAGGAPADDAGSGASGDAGGQGGPRGAGGGCNAAARRESGTQLPAIAAILVLVALRRRRRALTDR